MPKSNEEAFFGLRHTKHVFSMRSNIKTPQSPLSKKDGNLTEKPIKIT
jgi:hypothetical protein